MPKTYSINFTEELKDLISKSKADLKELSPNKDNFSIDASFSIITESWTITVTKEKKGNYSDIIFKDTWIYNEKSGKEYPKNKNQIRSFDKLSKEIFFIQLHIRNLLEIGSSISSQ